MYDPSLDYVNSLVDEIALEGLDGITVQGLWVRLGDRPSFCMSLDDKSKVFMWEVIKQMQEVEFYELQTPRKPLALFNRYDFVDPELGSVLEPDHEIDDIYPFSPVDDKENGIMGSCSTYDQRKNITDEVRQVSLPVAVEKWNNSLVIVASQDVRNMVLMGDKLSLMMEMSAKQYCVLERIGRSRYHGEVTQGKISLNQLKEDPKSLFYYRKFLIKHSLVCKQIHHQKTSSGQNCTGSLFHLPRFYVERKPKALFLTEKVIEILKTRPNYLAEYEEIRQQLGLVNSLKKLFKAVEFQRFVKTDLKIPYRSLYPNAPPSEWKHKANDREKQIRVIQLVNPNMDISELWQKDDDLDDDEEEASTSGYLDQRAVVLDRPLLQQAYYAIEDAGPDGCTQYELGTKLGQPKLESRTLCRNLLRRGMVSTFMRDVGRQRVFRFISKIYEKEGELLRQLKREKDKMLGLVKQQKKEQESMEKDREDCESVPEVKVNENEPEESEVAIDEEIEKSSPSKGAVDANEPGPSKESAHEVDHSEPKVETEVVEASTSVKGLKSNSISFTEELKKFTWNQKKDIPAITYRLLKRSNLIMEQVRALKVIDDHTKLMRLIFEEESKEGYHVKIDKKSLLRLLTKLGKDGYVKNIRTVLQCGEKKKVLNFVCDPSISTDHTIIQSAIEQAKMKYFVPTREKMKKTQEAKIQEDNQKELSKTFETDMISKSVLELKEMTPQTKIEGMNSVPCDRTVGKKYGVCPKFIRMQLLHQFLFYIVYEYEGNDDLDQNEAIEQLVAKGCEISDDLLSEFSTIYVPEVCWKMFINPLPKHTGWPTGWTIMCDILLRLPLSVFVKIVNITHEVPNLESYLKHPIRQHYLVKHLPVQIRNYLLLGRKYIFSVHEIVSRLCFIGLVQFGPQRLKEKDQVFIYINRKASLLDTRASKPGYHQISEECTYDMHNYLLINLSDVDKYWYDMWNICLHTQLGGRMCVAGKDITLEVLHQKAAMVQVSLPRLPEEAPLLDDGTIPGDKKGAGGLDSALFSHLKRNWNWHNNPNPRQSAVNMLGAGHLQPEQRATRLARLKANTMRFNVGEAIKKKSTEYMQSSLMSGKKRTSRVPKKMEPSASKTETEAPQSKRGRKSKQFVRTVKPYNQTRRKRPYYDEVDQSALKLMNKLRVDWSPEEDTLLLLCKVASMYLCSNPRKMSISFTTVRDILHKNIPASKNKTSRACQRRILYVMKNHATSHSVALCLEEVKQDPVVTETFGKVVEQLRRSAENIEELEKLIAEKFVQLVEILQDKFKTSPESDFDTIIPTSMEEFHDQYTVIFPSATLKNRGKFQDVKNIVDIYLCVVNAMIHSSLCCVSDKTSWAYQLFKVYQQYPDNLLRAAMGKLRSDQMVSLKKYYMKSFYKAGNYLPLSSSPYQLSISYCHLLQTKYHYEIFCESYEMLEKLIKNNSDSLNGESSQFEVIASNGGMGAAVVELFSRRHLCLELEIPEQIIILDPRFSEKDEPFRRILEHYRELLSKSKVAKELKSSFIYSDIMMDHSEDTQDSLSTRKRKHSENTEATTSKRAKPSTSEQMEDESSRLSTSELDEDIDKPTSDAILPETEDKKDENSESDSNLTHYVTSKNAEQSALARAATRIALYMMREDQQKSPLEETQHAHDFFVVNSCRVFSKLVNEGNRDSNLAQIYLGQYGESVSIMEDLLPLNPATIKEVLENVTSHTLVPSTMITTKEIEKRYLCEEKSAADFKNAKDIISFIALKKELGATIKDLREKFSGKLNGMKLSEHLHLLSDMMVIIYCGVTTVHYVHQSFSKPWLIHAHKLHRTYKEKFQTTTAKAMDTDSLAYMCDADPSTSQGTTDGEAKEETLTDCGDYLEDLKKLSVEGYKTNTVVQGQSSATEKTGNAPCEAKSAECEDVSTNETKSCDNVDGNNADKASTSGSELPLKAENQSKSEDNSPRIKRRRRALSMSHDVEEKIKNIDWSPMEQIHVRIRPWVRVDGTLNRRVLDRMLGTVLGYSMQQPANTLKEFGERFSPALQPVHTRELIEILEKLGCVKMYVVRRSCKTTLFSDPAKIKIERADGTEDEARVIVEPQVDAVLKLGQFIGNKKYSKDFLQNSEI